jgi:hypothetical protein
MAIFRFSNIESLAGMVKSTGLAKSRPAARAEPRVGRYAVDDNFLTFKKAMTLLAELYLLAD